MIAPLLSEEQVREFIPQLTRNDLKVLSRLDQCDHILDDQSLDNTTRDILKKLAALGLADVGHHGTTTAPLWAWIASGNTSRAIRLCADGFRAAQLAAEDVPPVTSGIWFTVG